MPLEGEGPLQLVVKAQAEAAEACDDQDTPEEAEDRAGRTGRGVLWSCPSLGQQ